MRRFLTIVLVATGIVCSAMTTAHASTAHIKDTVNYKKHTIHFTYKVNIQHIRMLNVHVIADLLRDAKRRGARIAEKKYDKKQAALAAASSYYTPTYTGGSGGWYAVARCESGFKPANGTFVGYLGIRRENWIAYGGPPLPKEGTPWPYSLSVDISVAVRIQPYPPDESHGCVGW